ncbi:hypothetical protein ACA29_09415 [Lederbergia galactosidilytica]|uniref:Uncharacterized protein n=1 Tax=Lederbergia galactosidilytica TaxID=217031 RepID=A0A0Q9YAZ6_9BACI|nr:hypothetical protein ACA29_09415 [Lederbergia galactosidilytica]
MSTGLLIQLFKSFNNPNLEGDERQIQETNKIMSLGLLMLISTMVVYSIVFETVTMRTEINIPFSFFEQMMFMVGIICFICSLFLCKAGSASGITAFVIIFSGCVFPTFLLSRLPIVFLDGYQIISLLISLVIFPLFILSSYFLFNYLFQRSSLID